MKKALLPKNETERQAALDQYQITDTAPEIAFDDITELASWITQKPIALVSLIDGDRQWFKSKVGLAAAQTPRDVSFCGHAIHGDTLFEVKDALADERFADNPLVTGDPRVIFYAGVPLTTPQGLNVGTLCVIDNKAGALTEQQRDMLTKLGRQVVAQMELRKRSLALEALANDALAANRALASANTTKTQFIANMSHEIRTPLNAITGALQILEDKQLPSDDIKMIAMARSASETVMQLINDILDLSKIDSGRMKINLEPVEIDKTTASICDVFAAKALLNEITLSVELSQQDPVPVLADELRVKQILMNVIGNALKFTPRGGRISVRMTAQACGPDYLVTWVVANSGIGMSESTLAKLGQPFEQGESGIQKKFGGTGLGLAMVKRLVSLLHGTIDIDSEMGRGSTFKIAIPFQKQVTEKLAAAADSDTGPIDVCPTLIVDDTQTNRIVLTKLLSHLGFNPDEAPSGPDALKKFRNTRPELVFLDIQMPGMDGYEVIKNIREIERATPTVPRAFVIAVTGMAYSEDIKKCELAGFDAHLPKPVSKNLLKNLLRNRKKPNGSP